MPILNLDQGSQEWLDYRKGKVMATDASVLMQSNPWKKPIDIWEEKLGIKEPASLNDSMKRGQILEPEARNLAMDIIGIEFEPVVYESERYNFMAASLDGISICGKKILEIKCPKHETHQDAINGMVPLYYIDQMQHQLFVTGAECCFYFSYRPENKENPYAMVMFESNLGRQEQIMEKSQEFYVQLCTMQPPKEWKFSDFKTKTGVK